MNKSNNSYILVIVSEKYLKHYIKNKKYLNKLALKLKAKLYIIKTKNFINFLDKIKIWKEFLSKFNGNELYYFDVDLVFNKKFLDKILLEKNCFIYEKYKKVQIVHGCFFKITFKFEEFFLINLYSKIKKKFINKTISWPWFYHHPDEYFLLLIMKKINKNHKIKKIYYKKGQYYEIK